MSRYAVWYLLVTITALALFGRATHSVPIEVDNDNDDESAKKRRGQEWVNSCRQQGFDPSQLACQTCQILPTTHHQKACQECCQPYKDTKSLRKPYKSAVLVVPSNADEHDQELTTFLAEDWNDLVAAANGGSGGGGSSGSSRLQKIQKSGDDKDRRGMGGFWFFRRTPAEIHFLDVPLSSSSSSLSPKDEDSIQDMAKETISLYGWKREDMKDMIQTLLEGEKQ